MKNKFRRINVRVDPALYSQIEKNAADSSLKIATYTKQLIQQTMKNNFNNNDKNG